MVIATCPFCSHNQKTKSKLQNITCSSCRKKYPNPIYKKENSKEKVKDFVDKVEDKFLEEKGVKIKLD